MSDLAYLSIAEGSRLMRTRALSPVEWTKALLDRIEALNPGYGAFLTQMAQPALAEAKAAEAEIAGGVWRGPMHGVPYAAKDIFDVAGLATTCHSKIRGRHGAMADATVIRRLREAGAVLLGKLALHEFATGGPTLDLPWPPARNPWNRDVHPGGSSSGSAVALAVGMVPAALGTDTAGSVRNPSTVCGTVGMKPTYGAVSRAGVFPLAFSLDHVGPMTRNVEDNAIFLQAIAIHDPADPTSSRRALGDCVGGLRRGVEGLKIGVIEHFFREDAAANAEQVAALEKALDVLRGLGAELRPVRLSPLGRWAECGRIIHQAEAYAVHERNLQTRPEDYAQITRSKLLPGAFIAAADYIKAQQERTLLAREFAEAMRGLEAVVTLSGLELPCRLDDPDAIARTYERHCRMPFNVTGTPAIAVPTGYAASGLPLGMQIAGRAFEEPMVYRVAFAYGEATHWSDRRPLVAMPQRDLSHA
jgi:aspartyl-tRNA(Asn)/glutamyl-tRNA(Gln) amidotransferase subunit A